MSGGEEETVEPLATVLPMEETIEALLDHLLPPLLSARESIALPPSDHQQDIVAEQMHAIVILCNYYHRKQFKKLKFLCFESFCKIACIFRPTLLMYMRYMHRSEKDLEVHNISKTEKTILDACDICNALDASKDSPDIEGWPISKVAVFLVSPTKEKCLLELCSTTQRHWLLVEKNLEAPFKIVTRKGNTRTYALSKERTSGGTSKSDDVFEEGFEQLAFSAVEQETGISSSDFSILESHVTYSLDRERTSTLLCIMKYGIIVNKELVEVPISDVINSVKGPIVKKGLPFVTTQVVEYFHILPYIEFIADWLSRDTTHVGSLPMPWKDFQDEDHSFESDRIPAKDDHEHNGNFDLVEKMVNFQKAKMIPIKLETIKSNRYDLTSLHGSSGGICNPYVLLDGSIDMKAKELSDRSLQNGQNEGSLDSKRKTKDITYYRKGNGSCMSGSSPANYSCKVVREKHSLEPDRKLGMKDYENNKTADFTEHLVNTHNKEMSNSESGIVKNVADLLSTNIPSRAITKSENTTGISAMEPDGSVTMKSCSVNYEHFQNGQTQGNLTSKKDATKNANIVDGACINGSSGPISSCMEPGRLTSKSQTINDKHRQSVQTQENALVNDKNSGSSPKSQSIRYECSHNGQAQDNVTGKKDATKNANEVDGTCTGGSSGPISSCMESDGLTTQNQIINDKDHQSGQIQEDVFLHNTNIGVSLEIQSKNYECFQNGQTQDAVASKKDDTENANIVDGTCIGGSSGPISSCMEPDDLTTKGQAVNDIYYQSGQTQENAIMNITNRGGSLKNQSVNYQSFHNGQIQDIVMGKSDITKNANEVDGTCIGVSSSSCMELDRLTAQNKESAVQSAKMSCEAKCADGKAHTGGLNQDAIAGSSLPVVPLQFNSENNDRLYQVTESKKPALLQASLRVLQNKRNELCQQQRVITDEIAQCEMNIQTVLTVGKDNLTSNVEPIIEALNILCSSQVQAGANVSSKERSSLQWLKRRKLSEAIFYSKNPCQELDDICDNNSWTLPRYSVLPSGRLFQAKVTVVGTDFNFTCDGDPKSSPSDARESASTNMLLKLSSMACQRQ